jgi:hypothetical protein
MMRSDQDRIIAALENIADSLKSCIKPTIAATLECGWPVKVSPGIEKCHYCEQQSHTLWRGRVHIGCIECIGKVLQIPPTYPASDVDPLIAAAETIRAWDALNPGESGSDAPYFRGLLDAALTPFRKRNEDRNKTP